MSQTTIKSNADLHKFVKTFYETHATALNGIIDKLPENLRAELAGLRDSLNTSLAKLPPLEQVPAAQDAAWAFNSFADAIVRMQEYANGLLEKMNGLKTELSAKALALNGLEEKITKGELLDKTKVKEACDIARNEGAASMKPEIVATRKSALELAGLPVPGEDVLGLPADQYAPRVTAAKDNVAKLGEKGLKLGGKGATWVKQLAWLGATEFNGQLTALDEVVGAAPEKKTADPLLGNPAAAQTTDAKAPAIALL